MANPRLVKNIFPGISGDRPGSGSAGRFTAVGNLLFFVADDGVTGRELWRSDGTSIGTFLVSDIHSGSFSSEPNELTGLGGAIYFSASDGTNIPNWGDWKHRGLYKSDVTKNGTILVAQDLSPYGIVSPFNISTFNNTLYFSNWFDGGSLWKSDGSTSGTRLIKNLVFARNLTTVGSTLFFSASDTSFDITNSELWKTDGTDSGTVRVADILPGDIGSMPRGLVAVGNTLFFGADDGDSGLELWKSDGTAVGTVRVADINPGSAHGLTLHSNQLFTKLGQTVFFSANDGQTGYELWKSDGSQDGTRRLSDINQGPGHSRPREITAVGDRIFFTANDGNGYALWKSDGTTQGTQLVSRINNSNIYQSEPRYLTAAGNHLYFTTIGDLSKGRELWKSDGTPAGTVAIADIFPGSGDSDPRDLKVVANTLYFSARNSSTSGRQLWAWDLDGSSPVLPQGSIYTIQRLNLPNLKSDGNEGSRHTFRITRSGNIASAGSVRFTTSSGTATSGVDFLPFSRDIQFLAGEDKKDVYVDSLKDSLNERVERFNVSITHINAKDTIVKASTFGDILNLPPTSFSIERMDTTQKKSDGLEGARHYFRIKRTGDTAGFGSVRFFTSNGTAISNTDFSPFARTIEFKPGQTVREVYIDSIVDSLNEGAENFRASLSKVSSHDTLGTSSVVGVIRNRSINYNGVDKDGFPFVMKDVKSDPNWSVRFRLKDNRINPVLPTYVYIHGWQDTANSPNSNLMFSALSTAKANVINVDWSGMAAIKKKFIAVVGGFRPIEAASVTRQVGESVADFLVKANVDPASTTVIGHSLGSFVAANTGQKFRARTGKRIKELVALDNAFGSYDIDARNKTADPPLDFTVDLALDTTSYTASDLVKFVRDWAGDNIRAASASNAYIVQYAKSSGLPGGPLNVTEQAKAFHNGVIGAYADLFIKKSLHPRVRLRFDTNGRLNSGGVFEGVIVAPMPWAWLPNTKGNMVPTISAPKAIGWADSYRDPIIHGSNSNDTMFFDQFLDDQNGVSLFGYDGDDWLIANQTDNKGVDKLTGGGGSDLFGFGYQRYGVTTSTPYRGEAYAVVTDFNPSEDVITFGWSQLTPKPGSNIGNEPFSSLGTGVGFYDNDDLIAFINNLSLSQASELISKGSISFGKVAMVEDRLFA